MTSIQPLRYGISIDGYEGTYRFRRLEIARRAFDLLHLSPEEPAAVLSRSDPDGTFQILAERHFSEPDTEETR